MSERSAEKQDLGSTPLIRRRRRVSLGCRYQPMRRLVETCDSHNHSWTLDNDIHYTFFMLDRLAHTTYNSSDAAALRVLRRELQHAPEV
jgi:hypothetical protein